MHFFLKVTLTNIVIIQIDGHESKPAISILAAVRQLTRMAEPIPPSGQSSSYSLTTLSSSSSTDRRAETDRMVITTRIAVAHHFICRLRRKESCILGATSSQPTLPLHELPPARLVIHRQTSAHERRKGTLSVQSKSGILADFCPRQH